jgi:hypothetical protein
VAQPQQKSLNIAPQLIDSCNKKPVQAFYGIIEASDFGLFGA